MAENTLINVGGMTVKENVLPYTDKGVIKFPWQIVIVTAKNP